jgi:two-component system nitrate/nitrite response regulator NarL
MSAGTPVVVTHPCGLFREGLRQTLTKSRFRPVRLLCAVNEDIEEYLQSANECVWLLGVDKFVATNEKLVKKTSISNPAVRIVILSSSQVESDDIVRALNAGACGFLHQDITAEQLIKSLELIVTGEAVIYPLFSVSRCTTQPAEGAIDTDPVPAETCERVAERDPSYESLPRGTIARALSNRELAILRTLMEGASNKVIARRLVITEATVKVHMKAILRKLRLQNRTQAAIWASNYLDQALPSTPSDQN